MFSKLQAHLGHRRPDLIEPAISGAAYDFFVELLQSRKGRVGLTQNPDNLFEEGAELLPNSFGCRAL